MSDKNCYGGSEPPACPPKRPVPEKQFVPHCDVPPTATFSCPHSDCAPLPSKDEGAPKEEIKECTPEPVKVEERASEPVKADACAAPASAVAPALNSACGGQSDNSCEVGLLSMTREDGSSRCGKKC